MPSLADATIPPFVKMIYIGESGAGKTGSLCSLVKAGYKLRVLDYDNNINVLKSFVKVECPDKIGNVSFIPLRDKTKIEASSEYSNRKGPVKVSPQAFTNGLEFLEKWEDGSDPSQWGPEYVLVVDTLSSLGRAAHAWSKAINKAQTKPNPDARGPFFVGQQGVENLVELVASDSFQTNVILISHVRYEEPSEGLKKGYVNVLGSAPSTILPRYFNTLILAEMTGQGKNVKRVIRTLPTGVIDLKTPISHSIDESYPLGTGLATIFEKIRAAT